MFLIRRRTVRILLAIARGVIILTEDWIFSSISAMAWQDVYPYRHPKYHHIRVPAPLNLPPLPGSPAGNNNNIQTTQKRNATNYYGGITPQTMSIFQGKSFYIMYSTLPDPSTLTTLIAAAGGKCLDHIPEQKEEIHYFVVGKYCTSFDLLLLFHIE